MRRASSNWLAFIFLLALVGCSAGSKIGEGCKTAGDTSECQEGAVCASLTSGNAVCRKQCTADSECAAGEACTSTPSTSLKSCQPV